MAVTNVHAKHKSRDLSVLLTSASCALLTGLPTLANAEQNQESSAWHFDAATLLYAEGDSRVSAIEPVIIAKKEYDSETSLSLKLAIDTLTGASPNGATPSAEIQTFTSPSGNGNYTTEANKQPLDPSFRDTRSAFSANWNAPINRDWAYGIGSYFSIEHDYRSLGANGSVSRYLNQKNTTLTFGLNVSSDAINAEGGLPNGLTSVPIYPDKNSFSDRQSSESKSVVDAVFGITQVINRRTLMQFNYSLSASDGYLTDPYKLLSVIDGTTGDNYGGNFQTSGDPLYLYEKRPDSRLKQSLFWQTKHQLTNNDIIDFSYRYMFDDWGIKSHTIDLKYRYQMGSQYLEPQLRWYTQSKAEFYRPYLTTSNYQTVQTASTDYRLGDMNTYTIGLKYGYQFDDDTELYTRFSVYQQQSTGDSGFGKLTGQDLYPDTTATMLTVGYRF